MNNVCIMNKFGIVTKACVLFICVSFENRYNVASCMQVIVIRILHIPELK